MDVTPTIQIVFGDAPPDIRIDLPILTINTFIKGSVIEVFNRLRNHIK